MPTVISHAVLAAGAFAMVDRGRNRGWLGAFVCGGLAALPDVMEIPELVSEAVSVEETTPQMEPIQVASALSSVTLPSVVLEAGVLKQAVTDPPDAALEVTDMLTAMLNKNRK